MIRLILALLVPTALVALGMGPLNDVRLAFLFYVFGGCLLGPALFVGRLPWRPGGLPYWSGAARGWPVLIAQFLLLGPVLAALYYLLIPWVGDPASAHRILLDMGWRDEHRRIYAVLFLLFVPLAEEWWWRGRAQTLCEERWGIAAGRWICALAFSLYHAFVLTKMYPAGGVALRMLFIVGGGRVWGSMAARWGWKMSYVGHFAADAAIVAVYLTRLP